MSETLTAAGKLAPDQPWCHKCGLLYGPPEREVGTAAIFVCFDPDCGGWLLRHDTKHPEHLAALMQGVRIEDPDDADFGGDEETRRFIKQHAAGGCA